MLGMLTFTVQSFYVWRIWQRTFFPCLSMPFLTALNSKQGLLSSHCGLYARVNPVCYGSLLVQDGVRTYFT